MREQIENEQNGGEEIKEESEENRGPEAEIMRQGIENATKTGEKVKLTKKQAEKLVSNLKGAKLDYRKVGSDMNTMARAYVLGMYDDDIEANSDVIEELKDFKKHNKIVEEMDQNGKEDEKDEKDDKAGDKEKDEEDEGEDNAPLLKDTVVEHDPSEIAETTGSSPDVEFNSDSLNTQVSLDYARMREKMIHKYNGGFSKTRKEKEMESLDDEPRVSRFKAARLGM